MLVSASELGLSDTFSGEAEPAVQALTSRTTDLKGHSSLAEFLYLRPETANKGCLSGRAVMGIGKQMGRGILLPLPT